MAADAAMISFSCEACGQPFLVPQSYVGRKATCKKCGSIVIVPDLSGNTPGDSEALSKDLAVPATSTRPPSRSAIDEPHLDETGPADSTKISELTQYEYGANGTIYYADRPADPSLESVYLNESDAEAESELAPAAAAPEPRQGLLAEPAGGPAHMVEADQLLRRALARQLEARQTISKEREILIEQERVIARQAKLAADAKARSTAFRERRRELIKAWRGRLIVIGCVVYCVLAWLGYIGSWLIMTPTTEPLMAIYAGHRQIPVEAGVLEVWTERSRGMDNVALPEAYILALCGNDQRAETLAPIARERFAGHKVEVWAVNYRGYGGSSGRASLDQVVPAALEGFKVLSKLSVENQRPLIVYGQNLGADAALSVAAQRPAGVDGMVLFDPAPLKQLLLQRYGWFNLWLVAGPVTWALPRNLDVMDSAARAKPPAVFIVAGNDGWVPESYQRSVFDAYHGEKQMTTASMDGHDGLSTSPPPSEAIKWLWKSFTDKFPGAAPTASTPRRPTTGPST